MSTNLAQKIFDANNNVPNKTVVFYKQWFFEKFMFTLSTIRGTFQTTEFEVI